MTLDVLNKNENIVNAGYWVLQSVLVAKISSRKTKKSPIRKNKLPQKFRATHGIYGQENRLNLYLPHRKADIKAILNPSYTSGNDTNNILFLNILSRLVFHVFETHILLILSMPEVLEFDPL